MHGFRMTTRRIMVWTAGVALLSAVGSRLESFQGWALTPLLVGFGLYLGAAFLCGLVLDMISSRGEPSMESEAGRPPKLEAFVHDRWLEPSADRGRVPRP